MVTLVVVGVVVVLAVLFLVVFPSLAAVDMLTTREDRRRWWKGR